MSYIRMRIMEEEIRWEKRMREKRKRERAKRTVHLCDLVGPPGSPSRSLYKFSQIWGLKNAISLLIYYGFEPKIWPKTVAFGWVRTIRSTLNLYCTKIRPIHGQKQTKYLLVIQTLFSCHFLFWRNIKPKGERNFPIWEDPERFCPLWWTWGSKLGSGTDKPSGELPEAWTK